MLTATEFRHEALGAVGSTNIECLQRARNGDRGNLWITAHSQTAGRGRRGRQWASEPGNLYASLLLIDPAPVPALASLPLVVAVAVFTAVSRALHDTDTPIGIKWPNDILVRGAKVSGILLESETLDDGRRAVVIGCGINVAHAPQQSRYPTTTLQDEGIVISPQDLFAHLYQSMAIELREWQQGGNVKRVREKWLRHAVGKGGPVTVNYNDRSLTGTFRDIDENGCLLLVDEAGSTHIVSAGDLFFN